jgi:nitrite reductase/ring-hydroxylating ferredoxin subunit
MSQLNWKLVTQFPLTLEWPENNLLELEVDGQKFTLGKWKEGYYAFASKCPHASGRMAQGYINPLGQVVCPLHRYFLKTYPLELIDDGLFIGFKPFSLF